MKLSCLRGLVLGILLVATMIMPFGGTLGAALAQSGEESWVFYWYLCGSDLESEGQFASTDLQEMAEVALPENVSVVIQMGGASEWDLDIDPDVLSRYLYDSDGFTLLEEVPSANMGEAETLEDFLRFGNENFPADNRAVIFWNHGGGSVAGVAFDELYDGDSLTLSEIRYVFDSLAQDYPDKYELVGFDACLMATIDTAVSCMDYANWMVASEEVEPGCGWDYEGFFGALADNPAMDGRELGQVICDTFYDFCDREGLSDNVTLSVIDLSKVDTLLWAYNQIGIEALMSAGIDSAFINAFGRAARSAENYGGNNSSEGYTNMVDLGDLAYQAGDKLLPIAGTTLLEAIDDAVAYQVKGYLRQQASGISCYYNYNGDYNNYQQFVAEGVSPAFDHYFGYTLTGEISDEMVDYLEGISEQMAEAGEELPEEITIPQPLEMLAAADLEGFPVTIRDSQYAQLDLGPEIADRLLGVYFYLAYVDLEADFALMLGSDNDLSADWDEGFFEDNFRGVWGSLDGEFVYMEVSDEAENYQIYAVPVLCDDMEYTMLVSYVHETEAYRIMGLRRGIDENGMAEKDIRPLIPGDRITPVYYALSLSGDGDADMQKIPGDPITVTDETAFAEMDLGDGEFMLMFEMRDIQNNSYNSEAVWVSVEGDDMTFSK